MSDLISRQAAISKIVGMTTMGVEELVIAGDKEKYDWIKGLSDSLVKIINLPSAQPERKPGRWESKPGVYGVRYCSECGYELHLSGTNFCPNCGSRMEVDECQK